MLLKLLSVLLVVAQTANPYVAVVRDNELVIINLDGSETLVENPPHQDFFSLAWSPDGEQLAYLLRDENFDVHLMVAGVQLTEAGRIEAGFPVTWTPDGHILYAESTYDPNNPPTTPDYQININQIVPGAEPVTLGTVPFGVGCGGGSPLPADWQYWQESGGFGGGYVTLAWTDYGILYSVNCGGGGLALLDPATGNFRYVTPVQAENGFIQPEPYIGRLAIAPDGDRVAGIQTTHSEFDAHYSLVLIDLQTGAITPLETAAPPERVLWADADTLYYAAREPHPGVDLIAALTPDERATVEQITGGTGFTVGTWQVSIHQFTISTGADTVIYSDDAYQIGRMAVVDNALWFSQIANLNDWVDALAAGTLDPTTDDYERQQLALVPVSVWRLDNGTVELQGDGLEQFTPLLQQQQ